MHRYRYVGPYADVDLILQPTGRQVTVLHGQPFGVEPSEAEALDGAPDTYERVTSKGAGATTKSED